VNYEIFLGAGKQYQRQEKCVPNNNLNIFPNISHISKITNIKVLKKHLFLEVLTCFVCENTTGLVRFIFFFL